VSPVRYELGFYIPEEGIFYSYRRENHKSYIPGNVQFGNLIQNVEVPFALN
jgi:hypothetical protein